MEILGLITGLLLDNWVLLLALLVTIALFIHLSRRFALEEETSSEALKETIGFFQEGMSYQGALETRSEMQPDALAGSLNILGIVIPLAPNPRAAETLNKAGMRHPSAYAELVLSQIGAATVGAVLGILLAIQLQRYELILPASILVGLLMYLLPWADLENKAHRRGIQLDKLVPDVIDLFANACAAGVTFDMAADFIIAQMPDDNYSKPIKEDLMAWQADIRYGIEREECWKRMVGRSTSKNIKYFCNLIDQSEKSGGSVAESLFKMADFFRERRKQQVEAEIAQLGGKINTYTIIFIVVPLVMLIMTPVVMEMVRSMTMVLSGV